MFGMSMDIGIDLGTANVLVYVKRRGVVLKEPSVVAVNRDTNQVLAIGEEARQMIGRTPGNIVAIRPLRGGVIADYDITENAALLHRQGGWAQHCLSSAHHDLYSLRGDDGGAARRAGSRRAGGCTPYPTDRGAACGSDGRRS